MAWVGRALYLCGGGGGLKPERTKNLAAEIGLERGGLEAEAPSSITLASYRACARSEMS